MPSNLNKLSVIIKCIEHFMIVDKSDEIGKAINNLDKTKRI